MIQTLLALIGLLMRLALWLTGPARRLLGPALQPAGRQAQRLAGAAGRAGRQLASRAARGLTPLARPVTQPAWRGATKLGRRLRLGLAARRVGSALLAVPPKLHLGLVVRRIDWMILTLLIISIISFVIIQLPPGDYLTSQIAAMEAAGETVNKEDVTRLRALYNLDEPLHKQYFYWMGNLLRGDMGKSFEQNRPVTELIGETITLTVVLSIATLLFTWAIAIPIGIYSAVKQYSAGDYFFTFVGLIGIAVPNFLLALVLMYVAYSQFGVVVGGLFSPEYQRAAWSLGKVLDMLKHMLLPMIIIGLSGTAGLIRILRGNLLDELRKQYVITARAKGVGRIKLLLKYPVRVAINPFISTIGWLLPGIVSGTVITAVVLGLPTTGPLLLRALMNQDMYLAGSMVMLLSALGVIGTLISDLLLLWVDPRIRYEKRER